MSLRICGGGTTGRTWYRKLCARCFSFTPRWGGVRAGFRWNAQRGWTMAQAIVHRAREASERVAQILDKNRPAGRGISKPVLGLVGMFAALCVVLLPATAHFVASERGP